MAVGLLASFMYAWAFVASIAATFCLGYVIYIWYLHRKYDHIPGPKREGFLRGNWSQVAEKMGKTFLAQAMLDWVIEYGSTMKLFIFHMLLVVTVDPNAVKEVMVLKNYNKPPNPISRVWGTRFLGRGLVTEPDNQVWAKRRAMVNPAFHRSFLKSLMPQFNETADILMNKLSRDANGKTVISLLEELHKVTLDVIARVAFCMDINSVEDSTSPFPKAISKVMEGFSEFVKLSTMHKLNVFYKRQLRQDFRAAVRLLRKTGQDLLNKRRALIARGEEPPEDIMNYVLKTHDPSDTDIEVILDDFVTFFIAGQETTANTLGFVLMELGRRPDIMERLQNEVDTILGSKSEISYDDIGKLNYMSLVLKESLRLYPPAPILLRKLETELVAGGYLLPAKTLVFASTYVSSRLEQFFPDPLQFNPERFDKTADARGHTYTTYPFSLGPRNCIGQVFAQIEMRVLLAKFIQRFNLELDPNQSFDIQEMTTLRPKGGVMAALSLRS